MTSFSLANLSHREIRTWLFKALHDEQPLPRIMPDESPHLAILRLELAQEPQVRRSLLLTCKDLLREFCKQPAGERPYINELLALSAKLAGDDGLDMLAKLSRRFKELPDLDIGIRNVVLGVLSAGVPPQPFKFWLELLREDREGYASRVVSGAFSADKFQALQILPELPNSEPLGKSTALKLKMAWKYSDEQTRDSLVRDVKQILPRCGSLIAAPIQDWLQGLQAKETPKNQDSPLSIALHVTLQDKAKPLVTTSRLFKKRAA